MKHMKFFLAALICMVTFTAACADDTPIPVEQLPQTAKSFVRTNFKNAKIIYAEKDWNSYECRLQDGTELAFDKKGIWKKVDMENAKAVPAALIPQAIKEYVKANFPDCLITKIEKERNGYDIELSNELELRFNLKGVLVKMDD